MKGNWITIYDNSQDARIVYVSEGITDHTGWEPEKLIGREGYELFHPGDHENVRRVHSANVFNERLSSMISYRFLKADGTYVTIETIVHYCYNLLVSTNFLYDEHSADHLFRHNSVDVVFHCLPDGTLKLTGAWNDRLENVKRNFESDTVWQEHRVILSQERRFALILNRYTDALNIVYVSSEANTMVGLNTNTAIGTSLFQYVPEGQLHILQTQLNLAKELDMAVRLRFDWIVDKENGVHQSVEGIASCTDDGIAAVFRLAPTLIVE